MPSAVYCCPLTLRGSPACLLLLLRCKNMPGAASTRTNPTPLLDTHNTLGQVHDTNLLGGAAATAPATKKHAWWAVQPVPHMGALGWTAMVLGKTLS